MNAPSDIPTVDCHAHIFTLDMPIVGSAWTRPAADASLERYLALLTRTGVRFGVLAASSLHGKNDYALCATERHPNLKTTVIAGPENTRDDLADLASRGAIGVRFQWRNVPNPPDLTTAPFRRFLERIAVLGWHVELHDDARRLPAPIAAIEAIGLPLVIDHFGRPGASGSNDPGFHAVLKSLENGRTWVKVSAAFRLEPPELDQGLSRALLDVAGPERLLWGSDWPFVGFESSMSYDLAFEDFARAIPDPDTRRRMDATALRFYFGEGGQFHDAERIEDTGR